ncbi:MAG: transposase [Bacillota bacterium]
MDTPNLLGNEGVVANAGIKTTYPLEFRTEAVRLVRESGKSISQTAKNLGASPESLPSWIRQQEIDAGQREGLTTSEREKLQRLRRQNRILREEHEIPKKAAAFFVQENRSQLRLSKGTHGERPALLSPNDNLAHNPRCARTGRILPASIHSWNLTDILLRHQQSIPPGPTQGFILSS